MLQEFPTPCTPCSSRRRLPIAWIVVPYAVDKAVAEALLQIEATATSAPTTTGVAVTPKRFRG